MSKLHRLDQLLSRCGYCSRREARAWVRAGRVVVGDLAAGSTDQKVDVATVRVDGEPLEAPEGLLVLFYKPAGCVCTRSKGEGQTIFDLLPPRWSRRNPPIATVGRLDRDTTGVLLLTDLGELIQRWTSPRHKVPKLYEVTVDGELPAGLAAVFASGTLLLPEETKPCLPAKLEITGARTARVELVEGRYHQVKRMFESQGLTVTQLHRSRVGDFTVDDLQPGNWKVLPADQAR
jgi:16S rRNA pseudouridine516 synthase